MTGYEICERSVGHFGRIPRVGVSPQSGQEEIHGAQRATAEGRVVAWIEPVHDSLTPDRVPGRDTVG